MHLSHGASLTLTPSLPIGPVDIAAAERRLGFALPATLVALCLRQNGGRPNRGWLRREPDLECQVDWFFPIEPAHDRATDGVVGIYRQLTAERLLPVSSLPFARDAGGNFYLLDRHAGHVWFMPMDVWESDDTPEQNWVRDGETVADSFAAFLALLTDEAPAWAVR